MSTVDVDKRGRVYLPKELRKTYGDSFRIVELEDGIKLVPIDEDPVEGLKKSMKGAENIELSEIGEKTEEKAREQVKDDIQ